MTQPIAINMPRKLYPMQSVIRLDGRNGSGAIMAIERAART